MKDLCMEAAHAITQRIKIECNVGDTAAVVNLVNCLSVLDDIIYASKEDEGGEKE